MKRIAIKFPGGNRATQTVELQPGTTVLDVLRQLDLDGQYLLSRHDRPEQPFRPADNLFAMVEDGDLLVASALVDAGFAGTEHLQSQGSGAAHAQ
jgi:hypothetical protein